MSASFKIAIGQLCSCSNLTRNLEVVKSLISTAIDDNVRLIFFPEATDYISRDFNHSIELAEQSPAFIEQLQKYIKDVNARKGGHIDVSIGVHIPANKEEKLGNENRVKNVLLYINHEGLITNKYQKIHLFDVDVPNGPILKESKSVQPGNVIPDIIDTPVGKLGQSICYDIRFPELALALRSKGAELLCYPSAFTMKTGEAHWELLGKARAIDTQCFVVMPGQQGQHDVFADQAISPNVSENIIKRESWGHSMIISPWGEIIAKSGPNSSKPQLIMASIDLSELRKVRQNMPLWEQRRYELFPK